MINLEEGWFLIRETGIQAHSPSFEFSAHLSIVYAGSIFLGHHPTFLLLVFRNGIKIAKCIASATDLHPRHWDVLGILLVSAYPATPQHDLNLTHFLFSPNLTSIYYPLVYNMRKSGLEQSII